MSPKGGFFRTRPFEVRPKKTKGPYPPVPREDEEDEEELVVRRVPKARRPLPLKERSPKTKVEKRKPSGDPRDGGVRFFTYKRTGKEGPKDAKKNAVDISGADSESVVLETGNWFCHYSTDGGATFKTVDPTTVFPKWAGHDFCCDQIVTYVPSIDRFVWFMQHDANSSGDGAFRLAVASPSSIANDFNTAWTYWDFTSGTFGLSEDMDYPDLSFTDEFLHVSTDATTTAGRLVARFALKDLAAGGTLPGRHNHPDKAKNAVGAHLVQDSRDGAFWVGQPDNSSLQIYTWPDSSTTITSFTVKVAAWPNGTLTSTGPNGNDWLTWIATHVPNNQVCGATRNGNELWLAWTAASGSATSGGFNFPNAHVRVAVVDVGSQSLVSETQVWNSGYAFAYPSLSVNAKGEIAIATGVGGSSNDAHTSVGILGDHVVWHVDEGDYTPSRWGDYVTVRPHHRGGGRFAGFGYYTTKDSKDAGKYYANPFYVVFGKS